MLSVKRSYRLSPGFLVICDAVVNRKIECRKSIHPVNIIHPHHSLILRINFSPICAAEMIFN